MRNNNNKKPTREEITIQVDNQYPMLSYEDREQIIDTVMAVFSDNNFAKELNNSLINNYYRSDGRLN